jgi:nucleoside-diphosphate-sugar epimerase
VLITFPLTGPGQSKTLLGLYRSVHGAKNNWIQLGSSGIFNQCPAGWSDDESPYDKGDVRAVAEDELLALGGCVLNLSGLYGGQRVPRTWLPRLAQSKEDVRKRGAVHFIHGEDVARAIVAEHQDFDEGKRWVIADLRVYDWWDLIMSFSNMTEEEGGSVVDEKDRDMRQQFAKWVGELMVEEGVRALPRDQHMLGRKLDTRGFWKRHGIWPRHERLG